jgi:hypothetical protein
LVRREQLAPYTCANRTRPAASLSPISALNQCARAKSRVRHQILPWPPAPQSGPQFANQPPIPQIHSELDPERLLAHRSTLRTLTSGAGILAPATPKAAS